MALFIFIVIVSIFGITYGIRKNKKPSTILSAVVLILMIAVWFLL